MFDFDPPPVGCGVLIHDESCLCDVDLQAHPVDPVNRAIDVRFADCAEIILASRGIYDPSTFQVACQTLVCIDLALGPDRHRPRRSAVVPLGPKKAADRARAAANRVERGRRIRKIAALLGEGWSCSETAELVGVSRKTVDHVRRKYLTSVTQAVA